MQAMTSLDKPPRICLIANSGWSSKKCFNSPNVKPRDFATADLSRLLCSSLKRSSTYGGWESMAFNDVLERRTRAFCRDFSSAAATPISSSPSLNSFAAPRIFRYKWRSNAPWFYACRATRCHRDHWNLDCTLAAGRSGGPFCGQADQLQEPNETDCLGNSELPRRAS